MSLIAKNAPAACIVLALLLVGGCTRRETRTGTAGRDTTGAAGGNWDVSVPAGGFSDRDEDFVERGRLDTAWVGAARRDVQSRGTTQRPGGPQIHPRSPGFDSLTTERRRALTGGVSNSGASGGAINVSLPGLDRVWIGSGIDSLPVATLQVWLDRVDFSPGVIDGRWGKNTAKALYWFQEAYGLVPSGILDPSTLSTLERLTGDWDPVVRYTVTADDVKGPFTPLPEDVYEKAKLPCLCHENALAALSEKFHTVPKFVEQLNRGANLASVAAGTELTVPHIDFEGRTAATGDSVTRIIISRDGFYTHAVDARGNIVFHFPSTLGSKYDPSPEGNLKITGRAFDPAFHYQPKLFADVPDDEPEAQLPAGPNSPVGVVWMQLSKENYGIHGTATPETIGYESSHGCIRLTNWDAMLLARHVKPGVPVEFTNGNRAAMPERGGAGGR